MVAPAEGGVPVPDLRAGDAEGGAGREHRIGFRDAAAKQIDRVIAVQLVGIDGIGRTLQRLGRQHLVEGHGIAAEPDPQNQRGFHGENVRIDRPHGVGTERRAEYAVIALVGDPGDRLPRRRAVLRPVIRRSRLVRNRVLEVAGPRQGDVVDQDLALVVHHRGGRGPSGNRRQDQHHSAQPPNHATTHGEPPLGALFFFEDIFTSGSQMSQGSIRFFLNFSRRFVGRPENPGPPGGKRGDEKKFARPLLDRERAPCPAPFPCITWGNRRRRAAGRCGGWRGRGFRPGFPPGRWRDGR